MQVAEKTSINNNNSIENLQIFVSFFLKGCKKAYWKIIKINQTDKNPSEAKG